MVEQTIAEKLSNLYQLQMIDSKIDEIQIMKGELPMEVSDLEDDIVGLETRIGRLGGQVQELEAEMSKHSANMKEAEALILRYQTQMDNVKNNREFDALTKEIELQRLDIQLAEKKLRQSRVDLDKKQETLGATNDRLTAKKKELDIKKVELEKIIEKTEKEEDKLTKDSEKARKNIEERLIKAYDKIRSSYRNGLSVVSVERNSCGGCFNKIPPQLQLEIAQRKKIVACEHCGRILVDDQIVAELKGEVPVAQ